MVRSNSKWLSVAVSVLALCSALDTQAQKLLGDAVSAASAGYKRIQTKTGAEPALPALRSRAIDIDRQVIRTAAREFDAQRATSKTESAKNATPSSLLQLSFFNDAVFLVEFTGSERTHSNGQALMGRVAGDPLSSVVLVDNNGAVYFALSQGDKKYQIKGTPQDGYVAEQVTEQPISLAAQNDAVRIPRLPPALAGAAAKAGAGNSAGIQAIADDGSIIDLMVIYSPAAKAFAGGAAQIEAMIDAEVAFTNLIYQNSEVVPRLRLVYKGEVVYTEGDHNADLNAVNKPTDGILDEIPILRDVYRADLVSVWGQYPGVCGIAYLGGNENSYNGTFAISLVNAPQCTGPGQATMAHELGHSMGLCHDVVTNGGVSVTWVTPEAGGALSLINYASGYIDPVNRFRDVMAFDSCGPGNQCPRIPYLSNPALLYDNHAYYSGAVPAPLGDVNTANAHQAMNDTRETIAAYRPQLSAGELSGPGFVAFTERVVRVAEGAGTGSLKVRRHGSVGAVSVNYATAAVTATDGADFTGVSGTLSWADGDSSTRTIVVPILQDSLLEGDEIFNVVLGGATGGLRIGGATGAGVSVRVVIADDEPDVFPTGLSLPAGFTTSSGQPWTVDTTRGYQSPSSLRSAHAYAPTPSGSSASSDLEYTGTFGSGNISFAYMVASLPVPFAGTNFEFSIDGVVKATASGGVVNWTTVSTFISAGTHTLRWRFINTHFNKCLNYDDFDERCEDYAYIDSLVLPVVQPSAPISRYAYIANNNGASVSVINLATNTVVATIPVGAGPFGVAAHPDGTRVYVTNTSSNTLSVIDVFTQSVIATMPTGTTPYGVAVTPDGARVIVAHRNSTFTRVFDTATNTLVQDIATAFHGYAIALNPAGTKAYITGDSSIRVVDLVAMSAQTVAIDLPGFGIAMSPDGARYAVVMNVDKVAKVYSTATNTFVRQDNLDGQPVGVAYNPVSNRIYYTTGATNGTRIGNSVMTFDTVTATVGVVTNVGTAPYGIAVSFEGSRVYTANSNSANVTVLDTTNNAVVATIPVGASPQSLGLFITRTSRPAPPRSLAAAPGSMQAVLSFLTPVDNGGHAITQYDATCQPGNITAGGSSSPITVTGLTNDIAYTCNVTASNVRGQSDASATVAVTPGTGSYITSTSQTTFTVLSGGAFNVTTSGLPVTAVTATGALPAGVTLDSSGLLFGTPASGSVGVYPLALSAANGVGAPGTQNFTLTVARIAQVLNFPVIADRSLASGVFGLTITGGASAQPVTLASSTPAVCTVSGMNVTLVSPGTCTLAANQVGSTDYNAATQVTRSFVIRNTQAIVVSNAPANIMYNATFLLSATGGGSGNQIVFTSATPGVCTATATGPTGATLTGVAQGTCTVNANQAASTAYDAAPQVSASFPVVAATQAITYSTAPLQIGLATNVITSTISPNQPPVVLATSTPVTCSISGTMVTALQFGPCQLTASQAGNSNYLAAADVAFTLKAFAPLTVLRYQHTATLLNNGRILVAGGSTGGVTHTSAELYNPATRQWTATGSMANGRRQHTATLLADGRVLVTGGITSNGAAVLNSAEIYNPTTGIWSAAGTFASAVARMQHSAVRLNDGRVLIAGGNNTTTFVPTATVDIYDPATNTWSAAAALPAVRYDHAAVLLPDGRPMLIGGALNGSVNYNSTLIYDPVANAWSSGASMAALRNQPTATTLPDGRVLVIGGGASTSVPNPDAERYDPVTNTWSYAGSLPTPRYGLSATLLANGRVLVAGGANGFNGATVVNTTSLYDPASNTWTSATPMLVTRYYHTGTLLADGSVMLAGGINTNTSEVYLPELTLFNAALADATVGAALADFPLSVGAGIGPYTFAVTGGALPPGTTLSTAGVFSGTPSTPGNYAFTVTVTDNGNGNAMASRAYSLLVGYVVTPSLTGDGSVSPNAAKVFAAGSSPVFNFTKNNSSYVLTVAGSCGGSLAGSVYTVAALTGPCTVVATIGVGPPSAPFIGSATAGNTQATVTFSAPGSNGGSAILSYLATSSPDGKTGSCTSPCSNIAVTGLTNGIAYTFTVQAVNVSAAGAASSASNSVTPKGTQSIVFGSTPTLSLGATATIVVTGGGSGNPVVLTTNTPTRCSISGLDVTGISVGTCSLQANQAGNAAYSAASQVSRSFSIAGPRTITPSVANGGVGGTINPSAPVSAANGSTGVFTVTPNIGYAASMSGTCGGSLVGTTFTTNTISADCTVIATFTQVFTVPNAPTVGTATAGNMQAAIAFSAPASDGGSPITSYTATSSPGNLNGSCTAPCSSINVMGLSNGTAYTFTVKAINAAGPGAPSAASNSVTPIAPQVINFGLAPTISVNGTGTVSATGGASGNAVTFTSTTPSVCTITGNVVSGVAIGTCIIAANQLGNASFTAAAQVTQSFAIGAPMFTVTPSAGANGTINPSVAQTVTSGATGIFTVTPNNGYSASVSGTCGGSLAGTTFTTAAITGNCTVVASFTATATTASTTTLASSLNPSNYGQSITLTATASGGAGTPTGSVAFRDGENVIPGCEAVPLSGGVAQCVNSRIPAGSRILTAQYAGNATYVSSTSAPLGQTVIPGQVPLQAILYFLFDD